MPRGVPRRASPGNAPRTFRRKEIAWQPFGTRLYLNDAASPVPGTLPSSALTTAAALGGSFEQANHDATDTPGIAQASGSGSVLSSKSAMCRRFLSRQLAAQSIPQGPWQLQTAVSIAGGGPGFVSFGVYLWRPSIGAKVATIVDDGGTGIAGVQFTQSGETPAFVTLSNITWVQGADVLVGDALAFELYIYNQNAATQTAAVYYDGTTEASPTSNAANIVAPVALQFAAVDALSTSGSGAHAIGEGIADADALAVSGSQALSDLMGDSPGHSVQSGQAFGLDATADLLPRFTVSYEDSGWA